MADFPDWPGYPGRTKIPAVHLYAAGGANIPFVGTLGRWGSVDAVQDWAFDYADETAKPRMYLQEGEFISLSDWIVPPEIMIGDGVTSVGGLLPPPPTIISGQITQAFFWALPEAVDGDVYTITNTFETSLDRADGRSFNFTVGKK